jgi:hypothetical protein
LSTPALDTTSSSPWRPQRYARTRRGSLHEPLQCPHTPDSLPELLQCHHTPWQPA